MSILITNDNTKQDDAGGGPLIRLADLNSLTLPLFTSDIDVGVNNSSFQMEKLTPSAPKFVSESITNLIASKISAAFVATAKSFKRKNKVDEVLEN